MSEVTVLPGLLYCVEKTSIVEKTSSTEKTSFVQKRGTP
jgi:hypothetical protein